MKGYNNIKITININIIQEEFLITLFNLYKTVWRLNNLSSLLSNRSFFLFLDHSVTENVALNFDYFLYFNKPRPSLYLEHLSISNIPLSRTSLYLEHPSISNISLYPTFLPLFLCNFLIFTSIVPFCNKV